MTEYLGSNCNIEYNSQWSKIDSKNGKNEYSLTSKSHTSHFFAKEL